MIYITDIKKESLIMAVKAGNFKAVKEIVASGDYDLTIRDATGQTAIGHAEHRGRYEILSYLYSLFFIKI